MIYFKRKICVFLVVVVLLFSVSICQATENRDRNIAAVALPIGMFAGTLLGADLSYSIIIGEPIFSTFKKKEVGLDGLAIIPGAIIGMIGGTVVAVQFCRRNIDDSDISYSKVIMGELIAMSLTGYILGKAGLKNNSIVKYIAILVPFAGARIGANQSPVYIPIANFKF